MTAGAPVNVRKTSERTRLIRLIHVGKKQLGLDRDVYEALLEGAAGKSSSAAMTVSELSRVLDAMKRAGFSPRPRVSQTAVPGFITPRQYHYITGLWSLASRTKDERSLRRLTKRITGVDDLRFVPKKKAAALILALRDIAAKAGYDPDRRPE